jgi:hypothetical protein
MPRARSGMRASSFGARPRRPRLRAPAVVGCSPFNGVLSAAVATLIVFSIFSIASERAALHAQESQEAQEVSQADARPSASAPPPAPAPPPPSAAAAPATAADPALFRIFLKDGTALVSYGEFARVGDRVVFTLPLGEHRQQLATVGADEIDWTRTDGYTYAVRAGNYAATHGEADYAMMSTRMARILTEIAQGTNPNDQLRQAENARRELAEWPARHFGYKADEIRETLGVLDEVIAGLRAKASNTRFDISLVAGVVPPPTVPLLAKPSLQESIAQVLRLATLADSPAERVELLRSADAALDGVVGTTGVAARGGRGASAGSSAASGASGGASANAAKADGKSGGAGERLGAGAGADVGAGAVAASGSAGVNGAAAAAESGGAAWAIAARERIRRSIEVEAATDREYATLASRVLARADRRAKRADVRGLTRLRDHVLDQDTRLGGKRPQQLDALLATLNQKLDAAQRLRLARDRWALQAETFRLYRRAIGAWVDVLRRAEKPLNDIRALAGPSTATLKELERRFDRLDPAMRIVLVPVDLSATHASLVSAWQLADTAISQRQRAIANNDIDLARNASAAAAGSLMLFERVEMEIARSLEAPKAP